MNFFSHDSSQGLDEQLFFRKTIDKRIAKRVVSETITTRSWMGNTGTHVYSTSATEKEMSIRGETTTTIRTVGTPALCFLQLTIHLKKGTHVLASDGIDNSSDGSVELFVPWLRPVRAYREIRTVSSSPSYMWEWVCA